MCVLYACKFDTPDLETLERAWRFNPHGAGVAWREDDGRVVWVKGLQSPRAVFDLVRHLPLPMLIHLRLDSVGDKSPLLTHPFPMSRSATAALHGTAKAVLAHNGHVGAWREMLAKAETTLGPKPAGPWSDTRTMAWLGARSREAVNVMARGQRVAILDAEGMHVLNKELWAAGPADTAGYWASRDYRPGVSFALASGPAWTLTMPAPKKRKERKAPAPRWPAPKARRHEEEDDLATHEAWLEAERKKAREEFLRDRRRGRTIHRNRVVA